MANFAFTDAALYREEEPEPFPGWPRDAFFERLDVASGGGVLSDSNADGLFQPGEALTFTLSDPSAVFAGTFTGTAIVRQPGGAGPETECLVFRLDLPSGVLPQIIFVPIGPLPDGFQWPTRVDLTGLVDRSPFLVCFLPGTRIATPDGDVAVEDLSPRDLVLTADGRALPVLRVGRQEVATAFAGHDAALPVEIAPGALAEGVPSRPLRVTPDHALLLDGVLVQAGALVNGTTIRCLAARELPAVFPVFHVETAEHVALLAEGAAAESYVANVPDARMAWQGEAPAVPADEMDAPRAMSARQVPREILDAIAARAAVAA